MKIRIAGKGHALLLGLLIAGSLLATGCPRRDDGGTGKVTTLFTADASGAKATAGALAKQGAGSVALEDIESLSVTITQIVLVPEGEVDEEEVEAEEGTKQNQVPPSHVLVFEGELRVNLLDLMGVSEVLSSADVPAGEYTQMRLSISDPELVLVGSSDPVTDIQLTANGRLFANQDFVVPEGEESLLLIDFGGVHLVQTGNGSFVLTPQLEVSLDVTQANVLVTGTIVSVDPDNDTMVVAIADSGDEITVAYAAASILLPDTTAGTEADLIVGASVDIGGTLSVDGTVTADTVQIL